MDTAGRTTDRETGGIQTPGPTAKTITTSPAPDPTAAALLVPLQVLVVIAEERAEFVAVADNLNRSQEPGRRRESHPPPPTDPCVTVARYTALVVLIIRRR
jgi:hypothetical protein